MKKYQHKPLDVGFVILDPEPNLGRLRVTVRSIKNNYPNAELVVVVPEKIGAPEFEANSKIASVIRGRDTITSLMNTGILHGNSQWKFLIMSGAIVRGGVVAKYSYFVENDKDVLYSITIDYDKDLKTSKANVAFEETSLNGVFLHQKTLQEVGKFSDNPLTISRLVWMIDAQNRGHTFKGVAGTRMC